ncbi:COX15/CtaA family protein [Nakamurella leprariae]|uniref:Heme A synthase n=1 Tax=Nakamurella leprariae TaxID=2803911 RepID=A0A938YD12_9ACTN|nr:COX15/CtaA family protein [Nakamurella leprariae]MBM9466207.1 heme A synthase [Nakamurella leprariae]
MALNVPTPASSRTATPEGGPAWRRWSPNLRLQRAFALAAVLANGGIAVTGATVRVTGSGLGCVTWPECHPGSFVPTQRAEISAFHQFIEFGNRTLTGVVLIASLGTFLLIWRARPARPQLLRLALAGPIGVIFQAIWGGIVVLTGLTWWTVAPHMLISLVLLYFAIAVYVRLAEPDGPARAVVPRPLRLLSWATVVVLSALCITGTLVTAAGPHAGDSETPRLDVSVRMLAQLHADLMFGYFGLIIAMAVGFAAVKAPRRLQVRMGILIAVTAAQGLIGLVQYATGVPEALVVAHVFGAVALTTAMAAVVLATRERTVVPADAVPVRG